MTPGEIFEFAEDPSRRCHQVRPFAPPDDSKAAEQVPVCMLCHGPGDAGGQEYCKDCQAWGYEPDGPEPTIRVTPISLFTANDGLDELLTTYQQAFPPGRRTARNVQEMLASLIGRFLGAHARCVLGDYDDPRRPHLVTVPNAEHPEDRQALRSVLRLLPREWGWVEVDALRATSALPEIPPAGSRNVADLGWYDLKHSMRRVPVLVVDDVWDTGAYVHAAIAALQAAGAHVLGALVIGRQIDSGASLEAVKLWDWSNRQEFTFDTCCQCGRGSYYQRTIHETWIE